MKSFALTLGLSVALIYVLAAQWTAQRTREWLTALLVVMLACSLCACQTAPPAPVAVQSISLAPLDGEIRRAVRANDAAGLHAERARIALERAERLLAGRDAK